LPSVIIEWCTGGPMGGRDQRPPAVTAGPPLLHLDLL